MLVVMFLIPVRLLGISTTYRHVLVIIEGCVSFAMFFKGAQSMGSILQ